MGCIFFPQVNKKGDALMNNESVQLSEQLKALELELHDLEVDTFEIEDAVDLGQDAPLVINTCSSTSSTSSSSCCA